MVHATKRDTVQATLLPDAVSALALVATWLDNYNDYHPCTELTMRSSDDVPKLKAQQLRCLVGRG